MSAATDLEVAINLVRNQLSRVSLGRKIPFPIAEEQPWFAQISEIRDLLRQQLVADNKIANFPTEQLYMEACQQKGITGIYPKFPLFVLGQATTISRGSSQGFEYWDVTIEPHHMSFVDLLKKPEADRKEWILQQIHLHVGLALLPSDQDRNTASTRHTYWTINKILEYETQILFMILNLRVWYGKEEHGMYSSLRRQVGL